MRKTTKFRELADHYTCWPFCRTDDPMLFISSRPHSQAVRWAHGMETTTDHVRFLAWAVGGFVLRWVLVILLLGLGIPTLAAWLIWG